MADEVNVGWQVREDALTAVGAVTGDDDLLVGEPLGHHDDEFPGLIQVECDDSDRAWVWRVSAAPFPLRILFPLGQPLAVAVQAHGDGQGEDFGRCPNGEGDDQGQHDPVVSPTDQGFARTGDERVVMHAGAVEGQSAFATEGVVDGPEEGVPLGRES